MAGSTSRTRIGTPARPLPKGGQYFHQGLRYTTANGLYDNRARVYSPTMMRFLQNDPLGFAAGDANTYRYEGNGPTSGSDPGGCNHPPREHRIGYGNGTRTSPINRSASTRTGSKPT